jgi:hypothetical protein
LNCICGVHEKRKKWVMQVKNDAPAEFCSVVFHNIQRPPRT